MKCLYEVETGSADDTKVCKGGIPAMIMIPRLTSNREGHVGYKPNWPVSSMFALDDEPNTCKILYRPYKA